MKASNVCAVLISLAVTAGLVSGHETLHSAAFALALIMNVLAWAVTFAIPGVGQYAIEGRLTRIIAWPLSAMYWAAMAYSGHPYLLASSIMVTLIHAILIEERKKRLAMEGSQ